MHIRMAMKFESKWDKYSGGLLRNSVDSALKHQHSTNAPTKPATEASATVVEDEHRLEMEEQNGNGYSGTLHAHENSPGRTILENTRQHHSKHH